MNILEKYNVKTLIEKVDDPSIDLEVEQPAEVIRESSSRKLYVNKVDKSTTDIFRMIIEKELDLQPEYQRKFVWDKKTMSRFIESLLLDIPIPTIFLAENNYGYYEVIDGQQRLTTIFAFMKEKLEAIPEKFDLPDYLTELETLKLSGLETLTEFNQVTYNGLENIGGNQQRFFNNVSLPIVIIRKDSTEDIKYDIFSRINSGSVKLNNQELLNVMYRGILLKTLDEIASSDIVNLIFGDRPVLRKRFGYHEILLRVMAMECFIDIETWKLKEVNVKNYELLDKTVKKYTGRLNSSVMDYLKEFQNDKNEADRMKKFIMDALNKVQIVFKDSAFMRINSSNATSINRAIAEIQLIVLSKIPIEVVEKEKNYIRESFKAFLSETDENIFIRGTNNTSNVEKRFMWGKILFENLEKRGNVI